VWGRASRIFLILGLVILCQAQQNNFFSEWRPNADTRGVRYVGSRTCVECHKEQAMQVHTPMAQALEVAPDCRIVTAKGKLTFRNGPYTYTVAREGSSIVYSVSDGKDTITKPVLYCFGQGHVGQTFMFRHKDMLYETRVSYFEKLGTLDFTIGHRTETPASLEDALGRAIAGEEPQQCFGCHTTGAVNGFDLKLDQLTAGVQCEACHGPGEKHLVAVKAKNVEEPQIFNPGGLGGHELSQSFCGTCHTSFEQAMLLPGQSGINNIRFQPYRMFNSRGHNTNEPRISCLACHNPHEKLQKDSAYYDQKCFACHLTTAKEKKTERRTAAACPVSTSKCATCHMPKVELTGMHAAFTDHWIRIARPNEPTPR
jgi:cytochrome c554/c'-like protein